MQHTKYDLLVTRGPLSCMPLQAMYIHHLQHDSKHTAFDFKLNVRKDQLSASSNYHYLSNVYIFHVLFAKFLLIVNKVHACLNQKTVGTTKQQR